MTPRAGDAATGLGCTGIGPRAPISPSSWPPPALPWLEMHAENYISTEREA